MSQGQLKTDVHSRQRSKSNAMSMPSQYTLHPATQSQRIVHPNQMVPRQMFAAAAPPQVMTPEQLLSLQVMQQQQTVMRLSNQIAAMVSNQ